MHFSVIFQYPMSSVKLQHTIAILWGAQDCVPSSKIDLLDKHHSGHQGRGPLFSGPCFLFFFLPYSSGQCSPLGYKGDLQQTHLLEVVFNFTLLWGICLLWNSGNKFSRSWTNPLLLRCLALKGRLLLLLLPAFLQLIMIQNDFPLPGHFHYFLSLVSQNFIKTVLRCGFYQSLNPVFFSYFSSFMCVFYVLPLSNGWMVNG